jgi:ATP-dependent DNA helicase RecQ
MLRYFGEELEADCGHCGSCVEKKAEPRALPQSQRRTITIDHVAAIQALRDENHAALRAPRQIARFLCGISSPATSRDRLTRHDAFGLLQQHPFADVLAQCESSCV